jgi:hypothetical protein
LEFVWAPIFVAEIATGVWLLLKGADFEWWKSRHDPEGDLSGKSLAEGVSS